MRQLRNRPVHLVCLMLALTASVGTIRQSASTTPNVRPQPTPSSAGASSTDAAARAPQSPGAAEADARARAVKEYGLLPLSFEANRGQTAPHVKFFARGGGYSLFLTGDEAVIHLQQRARTPQRDEHERAAARASADAGGGAQTVVRMKLKGANTRARVLGLDEQAHKSNYFAGRDARRWLTGVRNYGGVKYEGVYPGIDLVYYGNQRQLEYDLRIAPNADPARVALRFSGAERVSIDERGDLVLRTSAGELRQLKPVAYQQLDGLRREVACRYVLRGAEVRFELGAYDAARELVIDPVLNYSTYLGGSGQDEGNAVTVDAQGNAYVVGATLSVNFPTTPGAYQRQPTASFSSTYDAFVAKLNPEGTALVYSTYMGGSSADTAEGVAVNALGEAHVVGMTMSNNFPIAPNALQNTLRGGQDVFVTRVSDDGARLIYSTYLGGTNSEYTPSLALNAAGDAYVAGRTFSQDFPVTVRSFQRNPGGGNCFSHACSDGFITQLKPNNFDPPRAVFSTYLGGAADDFIDGIALGRNDQTIYVTGRTNAANFPVSPGAMQPVKSGDAQTFDAFVTHLEFDGYNLLYSTYLGGGGEDYAYDIAVDDAGRAYVTGLTGSTNFPVTANAFQPTLRGSGTGAYDAFITRLANNGTHADFSSYLGGSTEDVGSSIAVRGPEVFIAGATSSRDLSVTRNAFQPNYGGGPFDAFLARVVPDAGQLAYLTYIGGSDYDYARAVATFPSIGPTGIYLTGLTSSYDFHTTPAAFQRSLSGNYYSDAFVMHVDASSTEHVVSGRVTNNYGNGLVDVEINVTGSIDKIVRTDENGNYSFGGVAPGSSLTLTARRDNFVFDPAGVTLDNITQDATADFSGAAPLVIKGRVTDNFGNGISRPVQLSGAVNVMGQSDYDGYYRFALLPPGGSYTVAPVGDPFFAFTPESETVAELTGDKVFNFAALAPPQIHGRVTDEYGNPSYVTLRLTADNGAVNLQTMTDYQGYYQFGPLPRGKDYTLTPLQSGTLATFAPAERVFPNLQGEQTADFTYLPPLFINGRITNPWGGGQSGVTVTLTGAANETTQTDWDGRYYFGMVARGGDYTVTPTLPLWTFAPASQSITNAQQSVVTFDFNALPPVMIGGRLADEYGYALAGATVTLAGTVNQTTQTDWDGRYYFSMLPRGGDYTVTPAYPLWTFEPATQSVSNAQSDQFFNFNALRPLFLGGQVTDEAGNGLDGVAVQLTGTVNRTTQTSGGGWYSFMDLPRGGDYTVTPDDALYIFSPPSQSYTAMNANQMARFSAAFKRYAIAGRVADANGAGLAGVTMTLDGGQAGTTETDANGNYSFTALRVALGYTITAARAGWSFAPPVYSNPDLRGDQTVNFAAARLAYTVNGRVTDSTGAALGGVTLTLSGSQSATTETDANGNYSFASLPSEGAYTVTPAHVYYNFAPATQTFANLLANQTADFGGTRLKYAIGGRVTDSAGAALGGVQVNLGGQQTGTTQTDANGNYTFAALPAGYSYTVTPAAAHYALSPQSRAFDNLGANQTADFTAALLRHDIAGRVTDAGGTPLVGVPVNLSGAQTAATQTDAAGNYRFASLAAGGNYNVTPFHGWYAFSPTGQSFNDLSGNQTANFTGTLLNFYITGRVTEGTAGVGGVTVVLGGAQTATTQTDAAGNYSFAVPAGGTYTVTASHPYFTFAPPSATFANLGGHQTANFAAARRTYQFTGYTRDACARPVSTVAVTLTRNDGVSVVVQTDANGFYSFSGVPAGYSYTLTPARAGYSFNPTAATFAALNGNVARDFTATPANATSELAPTADAYVLGGTSAATNFGTAMQLITRLASSNNNTYETYLKFDLGPQCTVTSVKLRLYGKLSGGSNVAVAAYSVANTGWTETGLNWNNKPAAGTLLKTTTIANTTNNWYEWDITTYASAELNAGRRVISLVLKNPATTSNQATFNSRQATANQPRLVVTTP